MIYNCVYEKIVEHACRDMPLEACGYLGGRDGAAVEVYHLTNMDKSGEHFSFDPKEQFDAVLAMRKKQQQAIAVYHSHPETPASPSQEDIRLAFDPGMIYVIVSLAALRPDVRAFRIVKKEVSEEPLVVIDRPDNELENREMRWNGKNSL